ncbi:putative naringenin-chalcone synthase [Halospina denitrificans]|uniref:Putative naringenin-chalcone synthase n=1 Tax=Halospina denitrificans TaxID=332522 RepID=A0A4R7JW54_9GAMM|nr:type III polyketide synthase [Halospina denitrificans]TDT41737.1 putative naringenin-chalcone synthase [Halospina denitrificans]
MTTAHINGIGTAVPEHDIHQPINAVLRTMLPDQRARRVFDRMAEHSGIGHRYSFMRADGRVDEQEVDAGGFYPRGNFPSTSARMALYETEAPRLAKSAVAALERELPTGMLDEITHLVVASCTGFTAPGLDLQLVTGLGLRPDVQRTMIGFMGCSAAVPALRVAYQAVQTDPVARVLVVNLELCSLHLQETSDLNALLPLTLFADGASAALVTAQPTGIALLDFLAIIIPDSSDLMTWRIGDQGFNMHLSGQVPQRIKQALRAEMEQAGANRILRGEQVKDYDLWAVHPGGRAVIDAVETGLELTSADLSSSRRILHDYGNMSSATVMFVLQNMLHQHHPEARGLAMAFGPGMVAETFRFRMAG